ncbi:DUF3703 domain-containing protein [Noviherbaspirillum massiliense]|uniref:DUF3703 domain-containing protein n=1 Tax=Noviherbaspirillum massiliense TaxID=1465823 RepID=UPI0002E08131|nr:DUF3703 domain-containing protein [Noviherbaspirillum massiliense]
MKTELMLAFEAEMTAAWRLIDAGRLDGAMRHLERAHVLGQNHVVPHVRSHWAMLCIAFKRHSLAESLGQAIRIILGALGSAVGVVPTGNTGGTNISMFARLPIDHDLAAIIKWDQR